MQLDFSQNYFELFGLPESFSIDTTALAERFRQLQSQLHPDRYASASDQERRLSVQGAALVNEASETLKDPLKRARYLLTLRGVEFDEKETSSDPEFLMEQMELREALAEVRQQGDPLSALDRMSDDIRSRNQALVEGFQRQFESGELQGAKETVVKLRFFRRLLDEVAHIEEQLEDDVLGH